MDKVINVAKFGTSQEAELGFEMDDPRGRQDTKTVNRLFPQSAGGGGQAQQLLYVNRYRPGNRYRQVRLNGTVVQFNAVKADVTFATEEQRINNVVNTAAASTLGNVVDGVVEFGDGGPLITDAALTSHAAGVFGFMTTRGLVIVNANTAVVADDLLAADPASAGRVSAVPVSGAYVQVDTQRLANMAAGKGLRALVSEPPTGFKANLCWAYMN